MKTDYLRYFVQLTVAMLVAWTISCSGKSGNESAGNTIQASAESGEPEAKLITLVSPEVNAGFKLNDEIEIAMLVMLKNRP